MIRFRVQGESQTQAQEWQPPHGRSEALGSFNETRLAHFEFLWGLRF